MPAPLGAFGQFEAVLMQVASFTQDYSAEMDIPRCWQTGFCVIPCSSKFRVLGLNSSECRFRTMTTFLVPQSSPAVNRTFSGPTAGTWTR